MNYIKPFEVVIIGGSFSGLSAAMALGRSRRNVLIIDNGTPCNKQTPHSHNFLTQDGETPAAISLKSQVLAYPNVKFETGKVCSVSNNTNEQDPFKFIIETEDSQKFSSKMILFATGINDKVPAIPGFKETWGVSTLHCPYCHGYEHQDNKTIILENGNNAFDLSKLISHWTKDLTVLTNGKSTLLPEQEDLVKKLNIEIIEKEISEISHVNGKVNKVIFQDGTSQPCEAIYARPPMEQQCSIPKELGCKMTDMGFIEVDNFGKTSIPNIFAAGDSTTPMRTISVAVASGTKSGAFINMELIMSSLPK